MYGNLLAVRGGSDEGEKHGPVNFCRVGLIRSGCRRRLCRMMPMDSTVTGPHSWPVSGRRAGTKRCRDSATAERCGTRAGVAVQPIAAAGSSVRNPVGRWSLSCCRAAATQAAEEYEMLYKANTESCTPQRRCMELWCKQPCGGRADLAQQAGGLKCQPEILPVVGNARGGQHALLHTRCRAAAPPI